MIDVVVSQTVQSVTVTQEVQDVSVGFGGTPGAPGPFPPGYYFGKIPACFDYSEFGGYDYSDIVRFDDGVLDIYYYTGIPGNDGSPTTAPLSWARIPPLDRVFLCGDDPRISPGIPASIGSAFIDSNTGLFLTKTGAGNTDWTAVGS